MPHGDPGGGSAGARPGVAGSRRVREEYAHPVPAPMLAVGSDPVAARRGTDAAARPDNHARERSGQLAHGPRPAHRPLRPRGYECPVPQGRGRPERHVRVRHRWAGRLPHLGHGGGVQPGDKHLADLARSAHRPLRIDGGDSAMPKGCGRAQRNLRVRHRRLHGHRVA